MKNVDFGLVSIYFAELSFCLLKAKYIENLAVYANNCTIITIKTLATI